MSFRARLVPQMLTAAEARLLADFDLVRGYKSRPDTSTGDRNQDRLLFEFARRPAILEALEATLGHDLLLWGVSLDSADAITASHAGPGAVGLIMVAPIHRAEGQIVLTLASAGAAPRSIAVPVGAGILLDLGQTWQVESSSHPAIRLMVFRYASSRSALLDPSSGKRLPAITLKGDEGRNGNEVLLSPIRGPRNAFAIPETYIAIPLPTGGSTIPLVSGHTDVTNDLTVAVTQGVAVPAAPLHEQLIVPLTDSSPPWRFRHADRDAPALLPYARPALVFEWMAAPQGYADFAGSNDVEPAMSFASSTVYLSQLSIDERRLAEDEVWSSAIVASDLFCIVLSGEFIVRGNRVQAPGLAILPAGVPIEAHAGTGGSVIRIVGMRGPIANLAPMPAPVATVGPVVFCIPLTAKRFPKNWALSCRLLDATLRSLYAQTDPQWRVVVAGNEAPNLTVPLDERFEFIATTQDNSTGALADAYADSGYKRGLAERRARELDAAYIYFCDGDDLIGRDVVAFIRTHKHPYGYVTGRGAIWDDAVKLLAPLPLSNDILPLDEQTASSFAFNAAAVPDIVGSALNQSGHVRFRENMYRSGRPLMDVPFPAVVYVRFTQENMSDLYVLPSEDKRSTYYQMRAAIAEQALVLNPDLVGYYSLDGLLSPTAGPSTLSPKRLSVLICTHGRPDGLERLLETLVPQLTGHPEREIIVVNDGTHDGRYSAVVGRFSAAIRYRSLPKSVGIAGARNRTSELALGEFLVFTDDDCEVPPHWLDWLDATLRTQPELDVLAGTTKPLRPESANFVGKVQAHYNLLPFPHSVGGLDQCFVTACLAVRAANFRRVGGFNTGASFAIAGEDSDLSLRLVRSGARTRVDPEWQVFHKLATDLGAEMRRFRRYGYANLQISRSDNAPLWYRPLDQMRPRHLPQKFREHFKSNGETDTEFSTNPLERFASRVVAALIQTSYDQGAADGFRR